MDDGGEGEMRRKKSIQRTEKQVSKLIGKFGHYLDMFDMKFQGDKIWPGPSTYFHRRSVERLRDAGSIGKAIKDKGDAFLEGVYATLTAWGMHRMGGGNTRLVDFDDFKKSVLEQETALAELEKIRIWDLSDASTVSSIWRLISTLRVGVSEETRLVAGSKAAHHFLPCLIPPVDRHHTIKFFYGYDYLASKPEKEQEVFEEIFGYFGKIGRQCQRPIEERIGVGVNTSPTKVIDNAIVAFVKSQDEWSP